MHTRLFAHPSVLVCCLLQVSRSKNEHVHLADESIFFLPEADESSTVSV